MDQLECVSPGVERLDVMALGTNTGLYSKTYYCDKWDEEWLSAGGQLLDACSCTSSEPEITTCVCRGRYGDAYINEKEGGKWSGEKGLGGTARSPIKCAITGSKSLDCFAVGNESHLYLLRQVNGEWGSWADLGGLVRGQPSVAIWKGDDGVDVFAIGLEKNSIMQKTFDGKAWQDWVDLGGVFDSEPECVKTAVDKIHCFVLGDDSYLYTNNFDGIKWAGWSRVAIQLTETPSCVVSNNDEVSCYGRAFDKGVFEIVIKY